MIEVSCCGFPIKRKIYYQNFSVVEIQQTFHHLPQVAAGRRWKGEGTLGFESARKAWQLIPHKPLSPIHRRLRMDLSEKRKYITVISKEPKRKEEESPLFLRVDPFCYCKETNEE
jgi:uncharacterized protein YecE (DUF72 family)